MYKCKHCGKEYKTQRWYLKHLDNEHADLAEKDIREHHLIQLIELDQELGLYDLEEEVVIPKVPATDRFRLKNDIRRLNRI